MSAPAAIEAPASPVPWRPTIAHHRAVVGAVTLIAGALLWRRPDLLVVATPLVVVAAWSLVRRPGELPELVDDVGNPTIREGRGTTWSAELVGGTGADVVSATLPDTAWVDLRPRNGAVTADAASGRTRLTIALRVRRWGRHVLPPATLVVAGPWGAFRSVGVTPSRSIVSLPQPAVFDASAPMRPADGLVGSYRSSRAGDGSEFAASRPFVAGDRMRHINWPRSLRSTELQVNSTWADQDTHLALVVDATDDVGASDGVGGSASSLDTTVRAAGAIAEHFVRAGDRVSLRVFGAVGHLAVPAAAGQASLRRVLDTLSRIRPAGRRREGYRWLHDRHWTGSGAELTVMLSPLIGVEALDRAVSLGRHGLPVVVVDTLPDEITLDEDPFVALAWRIRQLERRREIRRVRQFGIPVVRWSGPGSLDQLLRDVARRSAAPRLRVR